MRVTISHNKDPREVMASVDRGFDDMMRGLPIGPVQFVNENRSWNGPRMDFSFNAKVGILHAPVQGFVLVEERCITVDVDLPPMLSALIPQRQLKTAVESQARGLLGPG